MLHSPGRRRWSDRRRAVVDDVTAVTQLAAATDARAQAAKGDGQQPEPRTDPPKPTHPQTSVTPATRWVWILVLTAPWLLVVLSYLSHGPLNHVKTTGIVVGPFTAGWLAAWILAFATVCLSAVVRAYRAPDLSEPADASSAVEETVRLATNGMASGQLTLSRAQDAVAGSLSRQDAEARHQRVLNSRIRRSGLRGLLVGRDGRVSTSKVQAVLWTYALLYSFIYLLLVGWHVWNRPGSPSLSEYVGAMDKLLQHQLQPEYFVVLGFPIAAAIAAKALVTKKVIAGDLTKTLASDRGVAAGVAETVSDDSGSVDLLDFQYAAFNLVMVAYYFQQFFHVTVHHPDQGLPDLPPTLLALSGVSVATYLAKKSLESSTAPEVVSVTPSLIVISHTLTLAVTGRGFCGDAGPTPFNGVALDGVALDAHDWTPSSVTVSMPNDDVSASILGLTRGQHHLVVTDDDGNDSEPVTVQVMKGSDLPKA